MTKQNLFGLLVLLVMVPALVGCAGKEEVVSREYLDPVTLEKQTVTTTKKGTWWESENQKNLLEFEANRVDQNSKLVLEQLNQLERNAIRRSQMDLPPEARAYADALDMVVTSQVRTSIPASGLPMPKNMADIMERNLVPLAYLGVGVVGAAFDLDIGGPFGTNGGEGSTWMKGVKVGGDMYVNSERNDQRYVEEGAALDESRTIDMSETYETYTGNSTNSGQEGSASSSTPTDEDIGFF